jgi:hypothetical protein
MVKTANKNKQPYRLINKIKKRKMKTTTLSKEERIKENYGNSLLRQLSNS